MSRIPALPVAVAVAITAPLAALVTVAVQRFTQARPPARLSLVADYGIRNVPDRPPLWRVAGTAPRGGIRPGSADPVPPENPHAPPTPPNGIRQVR